MRVYVIGPVSGFPCLNREAFEEAARALRGAGHFPSIPHRNVPPDAEWPDAMRRSIRAMLRCNGVARLPDWRSSRGARIESRLALDLGMPVKDVAEWCHGARGARCGRIGADQSKWPQYLAEASCETTLILTEC